MKTNSLYLVLLFLGLVACKEGKTTETTQGNAALQSKTEMPQEGDWVSLFNGEDLDGWKAYNKDKVSDQWKVEDGNLVFTPAEKRSGNENLISDKEYTDFVLSLEWKISEGGNSGIMWAVQEEKDLGEPYLTGPEIQVLDDERHPDAKAGTTHQAGALYDMIAPSEKVVRPAGEWNTCVITINHKDNMGTVELNGTKIVEFPVEGEAWDAMVAKSKFAQWEKFGKAKTGHLALQDHGNMVSYKNIKIKEL